MSTVKTYPLHRLITCAADESGNADHEDDNTRRDARHRESVSEGRGQRTARRAGQRTRQEGGLEPNGREAMAAGCFICLFV